MDQIYIPPPPLQSIRTTYVVKTVQLHNKTYKQIKNHYMYDEEDILGQGSYGIVYLGVDTHTTQSSQPRQVAIKKIMIPSTKKQEAEIALILESIHNEVFAMVSLRSNPHILYLYDFVLAENEPNTVYMILEYCDQKDLKNFLAEKHRKNTITEAQVKYYFTQIIIGFKALYEKGFVHRDLKPQNILVHQGVLKVADFGSAFYAQKRRKDDSLKNIFASTLATAAPQIVLQEDFTAKCDMYSLGCVLYWMLYAKFPVQKFDTKDDYDENKLTFPEKPVVSSQLKNLIKDMLRFSQARRLQWEKLFDFFRPQKIQAEIGEAWEPLPEPRNIDPTNLERARDTIKEAYITSRIPDRLTFYTRQGEPTDSEESDKAIRRRIRFQLAKKQCLKYIYNKLIAYSPEGRPALQALKVQFTLFRNLMIIGIKKITANMVKKVKEELCQQGTPSVFPAHELAEFYKNPNEQLISSATIQARFQESQLKQLQPLISETKQKCEEYQVLDQVSWIFKNPNIDQKRYQRHFRTVIIQLILMLKTQAQGKEARKGQDTFQLIHLLFLLFQRKQIFCEQNLALVDSNTFLQKQLHTIRNQKQFEKMVARVKELLSKFR